MPETAEIFIVGESAAGQLTSPSREALAVGRRLAEALDERLACGLVGHGLERACQEAIAYGADTVYTVEDPLLADFHIELYLEALTGLARAVHPRMLLMARTHRGREVAPRLAARLGVPLAQDCLHVNVDSATRRLLATRPVYGGNAMATVVCAATPQFATIRPKAYDPLSPDATRHGEVVPVRVPLDPSLVKTTVLRVVKEEAEGIKLEDARVIVAGGRGLGGPEAFLPLQELANTLGAGIGASRAAVDSGWVPYSWQIGLTGKTVTPELYITVGISGASQHMAGCSGAKCIVAINKDREANIFRQARYGVVGDWRTFLPALTRIVQELRKKPDPTVMR
ncbi:MAG: electron transfer flavoprotein subunit alpha/FixB family protein [Nitrospinae bacterium]|nr:electron transfer flavoprotein subunit alpha/FixB family protein [Nitrospinota bacterium]